MNQRQTVAEQDHQQIKDQLRGKMDLLQEELRQAKIETGLDPEEDLVSEDELDWTPVDYLPQEWKEPEATPAAPYLNPPWETWVESYVESDTQTILDVVTGMEEVRAWWVPYLEFHRLVASKLIVMEWAGDPQKVTIQARELMDLDPQDQLQELLKLDNVVEEVREFLQETENRTLLGSLEEYAKRTSWGPFLRALEEHRSQNG